MNPRWNILPDARFTDLKPVLAEHLGKIASRITPQTFGSLLDPLMREMLADSFRDAGADEGTIWCLDPAGQHLVPAYNTGPNAEQIVGKFRQPINSGLICMVLSSEQPFVENEVHKNAQQSKLLDESLGVQTYALIAVPFYLLKQCAGVISCVQLRDPTSPNNSRSGFAPNGLTSVQRAASILTRLLEYRLLSSTVDWDAT